MSVCIQLSKSNTRRRTPSSLIHLQFVDLLLTKFKDGEENGIDEAGAAHRHSESYPQSLSCRESSLKIRLNVHTSVHAAIEELDLGRAHRGSTACAKNVTLINAFR